MPPHPRHTPASARDESIGMMSRGRHSSQQSGYGNGRSLASRDAGQHYDDPDEDGML